MKDYIKKQLEEQIGYIVNEWTAGNLEAVERRFGTVTDFILRDENGFIHNIRDEEKTLKKEMDGLKEEFVKELEKAVEQEKLDDRVMYAIQAYEALQAAEQALMGKYGHGLVESLVTYARSLDNDGRQKTKQTDDMDKFLEEKK